MDEYIQNPDDVNFLINPKEIELLYWGDQEDIFAPLTEALNNLNNIEGDKENNKIDDICFFQSLTDIAFNTVLLIRHIDNLNITKTNVILKSYLPFLNEMLENIQQLGISNNISINITFEDHNYAYALANLEKAIEQLSNKNNNKNNNENNYNDNEILSKKPSIELNSLKEEILTAQYKKIRNQKTTIDETSKISINSKITVLKLQSNKHNNALAHPVINPSGFKWFTAVKKPSVQHGSDENTTLLNMLNKNISNKKGKYLSY